MTTYETIISPSTKHVTVTCPECARRVVSDTAILHTDMRNGHTVRYAVVVTRCCKARVKVGLKA